MRYRPRGAPADDPRLGRYVSDSFEHVARYPLGNLPRAEVPVRVPVVIGVNWYSDFDRPVKIGGAWWVGRSPGSLGSIRGGHAVCLVPFGVEETYTWWLWYDQVDEGICVSEAVARCMGLLNRTRYQPRPLYDLAQTVDEWPGESPAYEGTSVNAGLWVAKHYGLVPRLAREPHYVRKAIALSRAHQPEAGIAAFRWVTNPDELVPVLGLEGRDYVQFANSWGRSYPRRVRIPLETLARLLREDGEFGLVTDR